MYAVFKTGGKQYKVAEGDVLNVEKISDTLKVGDKVVFDQVLLVDDGSTTKIGKPTISGAKVEATLKEIGRAKKVIVIKYKQKSRYFKKNGHIQPFIQVTIKSLK